MTRRVAARALAAVSLTVPAVFLGPLHLQHGPLTDLQPAITSPTDGARASVVAVASRSGTLVVLRLRGLDQDAAGTVLGAHVHTGPCVAGQGSLAGPHYHHPTATGAPRSAELSDDEVWLDVTVRPGGTATAVTRTGFTIAPGAAQSVVVHERATDDKGLAGERLACLPVDF